LKSFRSECKFVVNIVEENAAVNIFSVAIKERTVNIEKSNIIVVKHFDINSILEKKLMQCIYEMLSTNLSKKN
jgi:hypothetical protein